MKNQRRCIVLKNQKNPILSTNNYFYQPNFWLKYESIKLANRIKI